MSIFAQNFIVDEDGRPKLVKHLNKTRIDRWTLATPPDGWNKSGKKARIKKRQKVKYGRMGGIKRTEWWQAQNVIWQI